MSCGGIIAINGWHNPVVAFEPYVADRIMLRMGSQRPTTHENFSYVRNIIFYNQSAPKTAIRRLFAFRGRPDPDSVPSQSVIAFAFIAFISRSISA